MARKLKQAVILTIEEGLQSGALTGDLAPDRAKAITGQKFIADVARIYKGMLTTQAGIRRAI